MWQSDYQDKLRVRFKTHHSKCGLCMKHKLIIKRLGHQPEARRSQVAMLRKHLARQHSDRQVYWTARGRSRVEATSPTPTFVCAIVDSMDAQKHSWPRSQTMNSKEFSSFCRPRLTSTTMLIHGHEVIVALSPSTLTSNSSRTSEIVATGLTSLSKRMDLSQVFFSLQGDNCVREVKNNGQLRLLATWVATRRLLGGELSFLSSGHSHEDIDALFSNLRGHIESNVEIHTPSAFQQCIQRYFNDTTKRPLEQQRQVIMMTQFRDWSLV